MRISDWSSDVCSSDLLTGATVTGLSRRAKYGLIAMDRGDTLIFHLGMSGRLRIDPQSIGTHDHLILRTVEGHVLALNVPWLFGSLDLVRTDAWESFVPFTRMGPEPLSAAFDGRFLAKIFKYKITSLTVA